MNRNDMKIRLIALVTLLALFSGCATTMSSTWTKSDYAGRKFDKLLVIVEARNVQNRLNAENAIVERFQKEGINATNSLGVFPPNVKVESLSEDEIENRILEGGYDGVLVSSLATSNTRDVREGGGVYTQPVTYRYGRMIRTGYVHYQEPEYYRQETTFVLETRLYDTKDHANKETVVWSGQSEITDPGSVDSAAKSYSKALVNNLMSSGIIKK
jgi:hypothetical protein